MTKSHFADRVAVHSASGSRRSPNSAVGTFFINNAAKMLWLVVIGVGAGLIGCWVTALAAREKAL